MGHDLSKDPELLSEHRVEEVDGFPEKEQETWTWGPSNAILRP